MNRSNKKQEFSTEHSICVEGDYKCVYSPDIMYGTMLQSLNPRSLGANLCCFVVRQDSGVIGSSLFQHCKKQQVLSKHPGNLLTDSTKP